MSTERISEPSSGRSAARKRRATWSARRCARPKLARAFSARADVYSDEVKNDLALADFNQAIAIDAYEMDAYLGRGGVYVYQLKPDPALADFNRVIQVAPNNAGAYLGRAAAYVLQQRNADAVTDLNTYLKLALNAPDRAQVEQLIARLQ